MAIDVKKLFNNASRNTADMFGSAFHDTGTPGTYESGTGGTIYKSGDVYETTEEERKAQKRGIFGDIFGKGYEAVKKATKTFTGKDRDGYANRMAAYQAYLQTLKMLKTGTQKLPGRVGGTGVTTPGGPGRVGSVGRMASYEQKLGEWNNRMRKFALARYYSSLGKKR